MKKFALLAMLSLSFFGCARRQQINDPNNAEVRITVSVDERPNGNIVTVDYYENDILTVTYDYFGGATNAELGELNGSLLRARAGILADSTVFVLYFDNQNRLQAVAVLNAEVSGAFECSQSEETIVRCADMQTRWNRIYNTLQIGNYVRQALERQGV